MEIKPATAEEDDSSLVRSTKDQENTQNTANEGPVRAAPATLKKRSRTGQKAADGHEHEDNTSVHKRAVPFQEQPSA